MQLALVLAIAAAGGLAYLLSDTVQSEAGTAVAILSRGDVSGLQEYILSFGIWAPVISMLLMVAQALVAPVPSFIVTFANGLAFGVFWGWLLSVAGHALAAAVCFWIARAVGRGPVEVLAGRAGFVSADGWFSRRGAYAVFLARLVPGISFDAISYAAGVLQIGFGRFIAATILGTLPQTFIYAFVGQNAPQYLWLLAAVSIAAVGGFAVYRIVSQRRARRAGDPGTGGEQIEALRREEQSRGRRLPVMHGKPGLEGANGPKDTINTLIRAS